MIENVSFPIFFQKRVGFDNNVFVIYKFKTIPTKVGDIPSADLKTTEIKLFSRVARRTNIDELPQLFNVLKGNMSIVGPRPAILSQERLIVLRKRSRVNNLAKPGITGLAQVNAYDMMSDEKKVAYDNAYCKNINFASDMIIIMKTVSYIFRKQPTY